MKALFYRRRAHFLCNNNRWSCVVSFMSFITTRFLRLMHDRVKDESNAITKADFQEKKNVECISLTFRIKKVLL